MNPLDLEIAKVAPIPTPEMSVSPDGTPVPQRMEPLNPFGLLIKHANLLNLEPDTSEIDYYKSAYPNVPEGTLFAYLTKKKDQGFFGGVAQELGRYAADFVTLPELPMVVAAAKRLKAGKATAADKETLTDFQTEMEHRAARDEIEGGSFMSGVGRITGGAIPWVLEIMATGGMSTAIKKGSRHLLVRMTGKYARNKLVQTGIRSAGFLAAQAGRSLAQPGTYMEMEKLAAKGDDSAFSKAWLGRTISNVAEQSGDVLARQILKLPVLNHLSKYYQKLYHGKGKGDASTAQKFVRELFDAAKYHGIPQEMLEERFEEVLRGLTGLDKYQLPSLSQLSQEAVSFAIPGVARSALPTMVGISDRMLSARQAVMKPAEILERLEGATPAADGSRSIYLDSEEAARKSAALLVKQAKKEGTSPIISVNGRRLSIKMPGEDTAENALDLTTKWATDMGYKVQRSDKAETLQNQIDSGNLSEAEAYQKMKDAGIGDNYTPADVRVFGSTQQEYADNIKNWSVTIYDGAQPETVIEEISETYYKDKQGEDQEWDNTVTQQRGAFEASLADDLNKTTNERQKKVLTKALDASRSKSNMEWFSDRAIEAAIEDNIHKSITGKLNQIFNRIRQAARTILQQAAYLRKKIKDGTLSPEFVSELRAAAGKRVTKVAQISQASQVTQISQVTEITKPLKAKMKNIKKKPAGSKANKKAAEGSKKSEAVRKKHQAKKLKGVNRRVKVLQAATDEEKKAQSNLKHEIMKIRNKDAVAEATEPKGEALQMGTKTRDISYSLGVPTSEEIGQVEESPQTASPGLIEKVWNFWWRKRDIGVERGNSGSERLLQRILKATKSKHRYDKKAKELNMAIFLYINLKDRSSQIDKWYSQLSENQQKLVDRSQNLSEEEKKIAEDIIAENAEFGKEALKAGAINNIIANYAAIIWKQGRNSENSPFAKFSTKTARAKHRTLESILEGWAKGKELAIGGVVESYRIAHSQVAQAIADKQLIKLGIKVGVFSTKYKEGWVTVRHPNFRNWKFAGNLEIQEGKLKARSVILVKSDPLFYMHHTALEWSPIYAEPKLGKDLNNALGVSSLKGQPFWDALTVFNRVAKKTILFTGLFHHQAFARSYLFASAAKWGQFSLIEAQKLGNDAVLAFTDEYKIITGEGLTAGRQQEWEQDEYNKESGRVGKILDKIGPIASVRAKVMELQQRQQDWLFGVYGRNLKVAAAILEYRHLQIKYQDAIAKGTVTRRQLARKVADLMNDDFGGLHLGRMHRNPTSQHIFRLLALAPDWTESNIRTMVKAFQRGLDGKIYRTFWLRAALRAGVSTVLFNLILAGLDDDTFWERYQKAWKEGHLRWLEVDITPIYRALGGKSESRKYFSILGHFKDPLKFLLHPWMSAKHKSSPLARVLLEGTTGTDWAGRRFTTISELLGIDDKGLYKTTRKGVYKKGEDKGGKLQGHLVAKTRGSTGAINYEQLPSFLLSQAKNVQPIFMQSIVGYLSGEMGAFMAITKGLGLMTAETYPEKEQEGKKASKTRTSFR